MQTTANTNPGLRIFMQKLGIFRNRPRPPGAAPPPTTPPDAQPPGYKKGSSGIHIKPSHKGLFTAKANKAGMGVQAYASHVLSSGSGASAATRKQANFARNAKKWNN